MGDAIQLDSAKNWRALVRANYLRADEIQSGDVFAIALGPVDVPAGQDIAVALDFAALPVAASIAAAHVTGRPTGTGPTVDVYDPDGSILTAPVGLACPSHLAGGSFEADGEASVVEAPHPAGERLELHVHTGAGEALKDAVAVLTCAAT